jgi:predicted nucleotidyltransferase
MRQASHDQIQLKPILRSYLYQLTERIANILQDRLVGIYLFGSIAVDDFRPGQSDADILVVTDKKLAQRLKDRLAGELRKDDLVCPAKGLDLIVTDRHCVTQLPLHPTFEFSISIGEEWETEIEYGGVYEAIVLDLAICRGSGYALFGPPPNEVIAPIPHDLLIPIVRETIVWHRKRLFDPFHDPYGHYAVLNACRAWRFAEERTLCSKTAGAEWVISRHPGHEIVRKALDIRLGRSIRKLNRASVQRFLDIAESKC